MRGGRTTKHRAEESPLAPAASIMSTIAKPRDPSVSSFRRVPSSQAIVTPTSSTRPSLDLPRSASNSPNPNTGAFAAAGAPPSSSAPKRANRAALREYYNLKKNVAAAAGGGAGTPLLEVTDTDSVTGDDPSLQFSSYSEVPMSEVDAEGFDADAYVKAKLRDSSLEELLRTYTRVLGEIRALDAEKKALVYDNYSKLITATETIRKVRMDRTLGKLSLLFAVVLDIECLANSAFSFIDACQYGPIEPNGIHA